MLKYKPPHEAWPLLSSVWLSFVFPLIFSHCVLFCLNFFWRIKNPMAYRGPLCPTHWADRRVAVKLVGTKWSARTGVDNESKGRPLSRSQKSGSERSKADTEVKEQKRITSKRWRQNSGVEQRGQWRGSSSGAEEGDPGWNYINTGGFVHLALVSWQVFGVCIEP